MLTEQNIRLKPLFSILTVSLLLPAISSSAQMIKIKLVDGRNGHPMVGVSSYVNAWVGEERKAAISIPINNQGVAQLQLTLNPNEVNIPNSTNSGSIVVNHPVVNYNQSFQTNTPYASCDLGGDNSSWLKQKNFSTKEVLTHGYVSANKCGKVTDSPQPGQVTLYVRPLTFREKTKQ